MLRVTAGVALAVALGGMTGSAIAQSPIDEGRLIRLDPPSRVVTLDDGRMYRAIAGTAFFVDNRPETFDGLRPGARIVVSGGEPVVYRQGRYIALPPVPGPAIAVAPTMPGDAIPGDAMPAAAIATPTATAATATTATTPATARPGTTPTIPASSLPPGWRAAGVFPPTLAPVPHSAP